MKSVNHQETLAQPVAPGVKFWKLPDGTGRMWFTTLKLDGAYGFIHGDEGDLFFHESDLDDGLEFNETLQEMRVQYHVEVKAKGLRARGVRATDNLLPALGDAHRKYETQIPMTRRIHRPTRLSDGGFLRRRFTPTRRSFACFLRRSINPTARS